jgi:hypothetical protein
MSYKIRRKFTTAGDNHYMSSFDRETDSFEATRFNSREEAERAIKRNAWKYEGFSSDWETTNY